ncbi:hypothetical protein AJ87_21395 [Rhizobium yanglingense]|nr:hypothetical protein AJ87_21395 [Rhizobium yanglingense]
MRFPSRLALEQIGLVHLVDQGICPLVSQPVHGALSTITDLPVKTSTIVQAWGCRLLGSI